MKFQYEFAILLISTISISSASEVPNSINSFASKLYNVLARNVTDMVFSPFSAHSALSLTYLATANKTAEAFERVLDLPDMNETLWGYRDIIAVLKSAENVRIETANKIYVMTDYVLNEEFRSIAENYFSASAENLDFSNSAVAADEINRWCKNHTNDMIHELVSEENLDGDTRALILNAVYFKGNWLKEFDKELTLKANFHTTENETVNCNMMYQSAEFEYGEDETLDAKILKMRYQDERFSMLIFLPNRKDGLETLEESLRYRNLSSFQLEADEVEINIPKFKFEAKLDLTDPLSELGLAEIFSFSADFSNLLQSSSESLKVDKVVQKACIEVNEEGSEAAASTAVKISTRFGGDNDISPKFFLADHPFLFYITAELGRNQDIDTILFMGKIGRPTT